MSEINAEEDAPFIKLCLQGKVSPAAINDFIEAWNKTDPMWREPLYEYLGMEKPEFALWVRDPDPHRQGAARSGAAHRHHQRRLSAASTRRRSKESPEDCASEKLVVGARSEKVAERAE
jgi:hypothetical protein